MNSEAMEPVLRPYAGPISLLVHGTTYAPSCMVCSGCWAPGAQWRELPEKYPPFQTCHRRFQQWVRSGKLEFNSPAFTSCSGIYELLPGPLRRLRSRSTYSEIIPIVPSHVSTN